MFLNLTNRLPTKKLFKIGLLSFWGFFSHILYGGTLFFSSYGGLGVGTVVEEARPGSTAMTVIPYSFGGEFRMYAASMGFSLLVFSHDSYVGFKRNQTIYSGSFSALSAGLGWYVKVGKEAEFYLSAESLQNSILEVKSLTSLEVQSKNFKFKNTSTYTGGLGYLTRVGIVFDEKSLKAEKERIRWSMGADIYQHIFAKTTHVIETSSFTKGADGISEEDTSTALMITSLSLMLSYGF
jgi:hypothetical protein